MFRISGVVLALFGMITTSFGFSLRVVRPFPILPKPKMTTEIKLQQFYAKQRHPDPMLPAVMHGLKRFLAGAQNQGKFDRLVQDNMRKHQISRTVIESMVKNWDALDPKFKNQWFPKELIGLDPKQPLDLNMFTKSVMAAAGRYALPKGFPLPRKLPPGITAPPQITEVRTAGLDFVLILRPGGEFTLIGRNFSAVASENRIQIGRVSSGAGPVELAVLHELTPTSATTVQIRGIAPATLTPGDYNVRVITNRSRSNLWPAYVETPPAPAARLDSVSPGPCQEPGQRVLLRGDNFAADSLVDLEFIDADVTGPEDLRAGYRDIRVGRPMVDFRNRNEIYFTIPQETWPGDYSVSVVNPHAASSLHVTLNVCTPRYRVELESIFCRDESDWESPGDDEIMVTAHGNADGGAFTANTATDEFADFSDGTRRPRTGVFTGVNLFSRGGESVPVKYTLGLTYLMLESDSYSKAEAIALVSALGGIADGAIAIIGAIAGVAAATIGAITGGIAIVVGLVIVAILLDPAGPNLIGGQVDRFTAQHLQTRMTSADGSLFMSRTASFTNDDDYGSYDMAYRIVRSR